MGLLTEEQLCSLKWSGPQTHTLTSSHLHTRTLTSSHIHTCTLTPSHPRTYTPKAVKKAEQSQSKLFRAEEDRRQALATSEALTALWQKKFEKAQNENYELRQVAHSTALDLVKSEVQTSNC